MIFFADSFNKQKCVYWAPTATTDDFGQRSFENPVELDCYWRDVAIEFIDSKGQKTISQSKVRLEVDVAPGGVLLLGLLADVGDLTRPHKNPGANEIKQFLKAPSVDGKNFARIAMV